MCARVFCKQKASFLSASAHGNRPFSASPCICFFSPFPWNCTRHVFFLEANRMCSIGNFSLESSTVEHNQKIPSVLYSGNFLALRSQGAGGLLSELPALPASLSEILLCLFPLLSPKGSCWWNRDIYEKVSVTLGRRQSSLGTSPVNFLDTMKLRGRAMGECGQGFPNVLQVLTLSLSLLAHKVARMVIFSTCAKSGACLLFNF